MSKATESLEYVNTQFTYEDLEDEMLRTSLNILDSAITEADELKDVIEEYDLKPYELREALLMYAMFKGEAYNKMKRCEKAEELMNIAIKKRVNFVALDSCVDVESYNNLMMLYYDKFGKKYHLTEKEFDLLKKYIEKIYSTKE